MMNWGETFQSWRNEIPSVGQIFSLEPIYHGTARNGLFIAPNEFGTPQISVLHTRSCCSTLDTPELAFMRIGNGLRDGKFGTVLALPRNGVQYSPESTRLLPPVRLASLLLRLFPFPFTHLHLADHHHLRIYLHFLLSRRNHRKIERAWSLIWILSAQQQRDVLARLPKGDGATAVGEQEKAVRDPQRPRD